MRNIFSRRLWYAFFDCLRNEIAGNAMRYGQSPICGNDTHTHTDAGPGAQTGKCVVRQRPETRSFFSLLIVIFSHILCNYSRHFRVARSELETRTSLQFRSHATNSIWIFNDITIALAFDFNHYVCIRLASHFECTFESIVFTHSHPIPVSFSFLIRLFIACRLSPFYRSPIAFNIIIGNLLNA